VDRDPELLTVISGDTLLSLQRVGMPALSLRGEKR
jgi:hypothetical protein